jgi:hypothetical protein
MDARLAGAIVAALVCWAGAALAQEFDHSHKAWNALLKNNVVLLEGGKASRVRYAAMAQAQERAALKEYLDSLARVDEAEFGRWTGMERMAFLINAYNAHAVEKVLTRYPGIQSIWDFGRIFSNPFKDRFFSLFGRPFSLDDIEHETLRKSYREPRVHYALNCASIGCPMLREEAYVAERLEGQLEEQAARFLGDRSRNRFAAGKLEVSKIFDWYGEDFEPRAAYFARYAKRLTDDPQAQAVIAQGKAPVTFLDYDWSLNDARK